MRRSIVGRLFFPAFLIFSIALLGGCNEPEFQSAWLDREIRIDGEPADWRDIPFYHDEKSGAAIGVVNDGQDLYLRLSTGDRDLQKQILAAGMTVWFDPEGGQARSFGIRFPLGLKNRSRTGKFSGSREAGDRPSEIRGGSKLELLGPGKDDRQVLSADDAGESGVEAKWQKVKNVLVYELKVPLAGDEGISLRDKGAPGRRIGIGFVAGKMEQAEKRQTGAEVPGGKGGMRGGRGGMKDGGHGPGGGQRPEPLEFWTKIVLASQPSGIGGAE